MGLRSCQTRTYGDPVGLRGEIPSNCGGQTASRAIATSLRGLWMRMGGGQSIRDQLGTDDAESPRDSVQCLDEGFRSPEFDSGYVGTVDVNALGAVR